MYIAPIAILVTDQQTASTAESPMKQIFPRQSPSQTYIIKTQFSSPLREVRKLDPALRDVLARAPIPLSLRAAYLRPLRRTPTLGVPVCDLQLRSFSVRNLEFFCDFALRVAYYLGLPAKGPVYLPKITERWTVPRSNFIHKKSQENFERITLRRMIQIQDGHPEAVQCWLGYLEKRGYHGIGMKANVWEFESLGVGKRMDEQAGIADSEMEEEWGNFGMRMNAETAEKVEELLGSEAWNEPKRDMEAFYRRPIEIKRGKK
jgi:small subunit ribosomal protein S10